ncbi:MAG: DUF6075 family protein [Maledivibacter sp.]|jgi:hypothetical protein|nr:DUF6075 family protein [Maledivibacter sp.]
MLFKNEEHQQRFMHLVAEDGMHPKDVERQVLFYILSGNHDLYQKRHSIYDFSEHMISSECLTASEVDFSTSSKALIRLGFNLYNGYTDMGISPLDIYYSLDEANYILAQESMNIRFGMTNTYQQEQITEKHDEEEWDMEM